MFHLILILTLPLHEKGLYTESFFRYFINLYILLSLHTGYRTKRVGFIGDGASKLLAPSLF